MKPRQNTTVRSIGGLPLGSGVTHIGIAQRDDIASAQLQNGMNVFWRGDRPIGHVTICNGEIVDSNIARVDDAFLQCITKEEKEPAVGPAETSISVVICTRDRPDELRACLASLPKQSRRPSEVIVVDNASQDARTREVALSAGAVYVREDRPGLGIARNTGITHAKSEIVAFTDDDVLLHPRWLAELVSAFDSPHVAAALGLVLPAELETESQKHFERYWSFGRGYRERVFDTSMFNSHVGSVFPAWEIGAGANMALRRETCLSIGLFDERLGAGGAGCSEDSEYWYRLLARGYTCRYVPDAVAFHFHRKTMEGLGRQIYQYMRGHAAALLVQYERTGIAANRFQAYWHMPRWYFGRLLGSMFSRSRTRDRFLRQEMTGYLAGLLFYHFERRRPFALTQ